MKKLVLSLLFIAFSRILYAQAPQAISYQAVIRNASGNLLANKNVSLQLTVRHLSAGGAIQYRETHAVLTNAYGLANVNIGLGTPSPGNVFSNITWNSGAKYLEVGVDTTGGSSYVSMGTQQLVSVPFALYSSSSGGAASGDLSGTYPGPVVSKINGALLGTTTGAATGSVLKWNGSSWAIGTDNTGSGGTGTVTSITAGTGLSGGTITTSGTISLPNVGTPGNYGSSNLIPVITTDPQGRVTNITHAQTVEGWKLTGNSGTAETVHFVGTTDGVPLIFRVNNQKSGRIDFTGLYNTFFGYQSGSLITTGSENCAFGFQSLSQITSGQENTAYGYGTLYNNIGAWGNTAIGYQSQFFANNNPNPIFPYNTSVGHNSLYGSATPSANTGSANTALGAYTLYTNTSGGNNTAVGLQANCFNTTGNSNTSVGFNADYKNTTGSNNTIIGSNALRENLTGSNVTAIGTSALYNSVSGSNALAIGYCSQLYANNTSTPYTNFNTSIGYFSLVGSISPASNTGNFNTAIGYSTLYNNSTGSSNTAIGMNSMQGNTSGTGNTAVGEGTLVNNSSGNYNTATGLNALGSNSTGTLNIAVGVSSLAVNGSGANNVAVGCSTLYQTNASNNTAVGYLAAGTGNQGNSNTFIGYSTSSNSSGYTSSTALGANTQITASNQVRIGAGATSIGGPQNWSNTSDSRIKTNVREDIPGLKFIDLLRPVSYNKSIALENNVTGGKLEITDQNNYEQIRYSGFLAQEVEEAAKSIGYDFSGVDAPKNEKDLYGLRYAEFVVPMVKAMQELNATIKSQQEMINALNAELNQVRSEINSMKASKEQ